MNKFTLFTHSYIRKATFTFFTLLLFLSFADISAVPQSSKYDAFVQKVFDKLLTVVVDDVDPSWQWPPKLVIEQSDQINAYATALSQNEFKVVIYSGILDKVIEGKEDRLAYILGHELSHITKGHVLDRTKIKSEFEKVVFNRQQEEEADVVGMQYALAAGYSLKKAERAITKMQDLGLDYSSFEGLSHDHPVWSDRIILLDKERENLWKSMSAFKNGNYLLVIEQYDAAASCYRYVSNEFRDCFEAYNNLGYALLMKYADALDPADIKNFNIGHLLTGGFYKRAGSIESQRAVNEDIWWEAVGALNEALKINPQSTLAITNLGIAYLIKPGDQDLAKAYKYFDEALKLVNSDPNLDNLSKAYVYINTGAAYIFDDEIQKSLDLLALAEKESRSSADSESNASVSNSILYNKALIASRSTDAATKQNSMSLFETFLSNSNPTSNWWKVAYAEYSDLCKSLGKKAKSQDDFKTTTNEDFRIVSTVVLDNGQAIGLSTPVDEVLTRLGNVDPINVASKSKLEQYSFTKYGVELIALDQILAITVKGNNSPKVDLKKKGLGGEGDKVYIGMPSDQLNDLLGMDYVPTRIIGKEKKYRYYQNLGLAIMVKNGKIKEIVIAQI